MKSGNPDKLMFVKVVARMASDNTYAYTIDEYRGAQVATKLRRYAKNLRSIPKWMEPYLP